MSEPQYTEVWDKEPEGVKKEVKIEPKEPVFRCPDIHLEIQDKLEKWYYSTFINKGLDIQTYNHIYQSVEKLKSSISDSFKEK